MPYIGTYSTDILESAIAEFKNINHPVVSYQIDFLDLKNSIFYKNAVIGDHFDVGDIGAVYDATIGVSTIQMITRKEYDAIKGEILSLTLGNVSESVYGMRTPSYAAGGTIASTQTTYDWDVFIQIAPAANVQYIHFRFRDLNVNAPIPYKLVWWDGETITYDGIPTETGNTITYKKYIPIGTEEIWIGIKVDADLYRPKFQIIGTGNNVTKVTGHYSIRLSSKIKSIDDMYTYDDPHELKIQMPSHLLKAAYLHGSHYLLFIMMAPFLNSTCLHILVWGKMIFTVGLPVHLMVKQQSHMERLILSAMMVRLL